MATRADGRAVLLTVEEARALQIGERMARTAADLMRAGGYALPDPVTTSRFTGAMADAARVLSAHVGALDPAPTDDEIDAAIDCTAAAFVQEAFGPAPMAH